MKIIKILKNPYLAVILSALILLTSCSDKENLQNDNVVAKQIVQKKFENNALINDFIILQGLISDVNTPNSLEFDNDNIYEVSIDENSSSMIMANQVGFNVNNPENYAISAAITENGLINPLIVKTRIISESISEIEYFDIDFNLLSTIQLNSESKTVVASSDFQKSILSTNGCGQDVADCLIDAYSNHGWVSVWAFVQTAFIPATGVALAAACAANECL